MNRKEKIEKIRDDIKECLAKIVECYKDIHWELISNNGVETDFIFEWESEIHENRDMIFILLDKLYAMCTN